MKTSFKTPKNTRNPRQSTAGLVAPRLILCAALYLKVLCFPLLTAQAEPVLAPEIETSSIVATNRENVDKLMGLLKDVETNEYKPFFQNGVVSQYNKLTIALVQFEIPNRTPGQVGHSGIILRDPVSGDISLWHMRGNFVRDTDGQEFSMTFVEKRNLSKKPLSGAPPHVVALGKTTPESMSDLLARLTIASEEAPRVDQYRGMNHLQPQDLFNVHSSCSVFASNAFTIGTVKQKTGNFTDHDLGLGTVDFFSLPPSSPGGNEFEEPDFSKSTKGQVTSSTKPAPSLTLPTSPTIEDLEVRRPSVPAATTTTNPSPSPSSKPKISNAAIGGGAVGVVVGLGMRALEENGNENTAKVAGTVAVVADFAGNVAEQLAADSCSVSLPGKVGIATKLAAVGRAGAITGAGFAAEYAAQKAGANQMTSQLAGEMAELGAAAFAGGSKGGIAGAGAAVVAQGASSITSKLADIGYSAVQANNSGMSYWQFAKETVMGIPNHFYNK